jgi:hypothetical protein
MVTKTPAAVVLGLLEGATDRWAKQRRAEERDRSARARRNERLIRRCRPMNLKEAAFHVMRDAYMAASAGGTLPANARQIYYAARPKILELTGRDSLDSQYFCQTLLVGYMRERGVDWNVAWDDRGHLTEPHTGSTIGLGTLKVRKYLKGLRAPEFLGAGFASAKIRTYGPDGCYGALLYIEKEGFEQLFDEANLAEKHDIAIMSCKGMSVTAARQLADRICSRYNIPLLTLHDFDIAGFSIAKTVGTNKERYQFQNRIDVIDLGLRLKDVEDLDLQSEAVSLGKDDPDKIRDRLRRNGATDEEIDFLLDEKRVELNAMPSDVFIEFVERKLEEHGIGKVVPAKDRLDEAFRLFIRSERLREDFEEIIEVRAAEDVDVPEDLEQRVRDYLDKHPEKPWAEAVQEIARDLA